MNILIVRIGRMGDMVMILPALREILKKYPNARLYAITSKEGLRLLPLVGIPKERIFVYRNGVFFRPLDNFRVKRWIKAVDFRHVFSFRKKKSNDKWLPKDAHILSPSTSLEHYSTRCLQLVSPQAPSQFFQREEPHYLPRDHHQQYIETLLKCYGIHERTLLVGLHPTYSGFKKWGNVYEKIHRLWPSTSFSIIARSLSQEAQERHLDLKIVMNVLPTEQALALQILEQSEDKIILLPDLPNFEMYLAFLQRLNVLVVSNTGVMHLAAMLCTPTVALFSHLQPEDCGPYMAPKYCKVIRAEDMPQSAKGLAAISPQYVHTQVMTMLKEIHPDVIH